MKTAQFYGMLLIASAACSTSNAITIPTVLIGNPGNLADQRYVGEEHPNGVGSVADPFNIGLTEITNLQYVTFLNSVAKSDLYGLHAAHLESDVRSGILRSGSHGSYTYVLKPPALDGSYRYDNKPVVFVRWGSALRFANWLHNGQPIGLQNATTTEDGAYTLNGVTVAHALAKVTRNPSARWWLPNEDEWYKAAYYDPNSRIYYDYPTGTNLMPDNNSPSSDSGNSANFYLNEYTTGDPAFPMTDAGAYVLSSSPYGTLDQGGSLFEWNERVLYGSHGQIRGGANDQSRLSDMMASKWSAVYLENPKVVVGFRVATLAIPEPNAIVLVVVGLAMFVKSRA